MRLSEKITLRSLLSGVVTCTVLSIVSNQMEHRALDALVHHESVAYTEAAIELLLIGMGLVIAYLLSGRELRQLYQNENRKALFLGIANTLGSFIVGFLVVGILLPAR